MFSDDVAKQFDPVPGYCNTASVGIPPRAAVEVLRGCRWMSCSTSSDPPLTWWR